LHIDAFTSLEETMTSRAPAVSRSAFLILLAIADQPRHGLGIIDEVDAGTDGQVKMGPGTLYGTLQKLVEAGLIRETAEAPDPADDDPRRRYYRITAKGTRALREEAERMRSLVDAAVGKNVLEGA
jgi:DNA-binding PadR family transcriptional regulator